MSVAVTLNLNESTLEILKKEAERRSTTIDQALNDLVHAARPFKVEPFDLGPMRPEFDINKINRIMAEEDFEIFVEKTLRDTGVDLRR